MDNLSLGVTIGAALSADFNYTVASAPKKLAKIGSALSDIKKKDTSLAKLQSAEAKLEGTRAKLSLVSDELGKVKLAMRKASGDELNKLKNRADALSRQQITLSNKVEQSTQKVRLATQAHKKAAEAAEKQTRGLGRLGSSIDKIKAKQDSLQAALTKHAAAQNKLNNARSGLFDATAIGFGLKMAFSGAGELQSTLTDIGITADISASGIKKIGDELSIAARNSGQTREALAEGLQSLIAAGLDDKRAVEVIDDIGKTATASGATVVDVSRTVFSALENLKVAPEHVLTAMDMLVQAGKEGSFELRDMAQYFPSLTADAEKLGLVGTEAIATLGASLQIALKGAANPSEAANNMKNFMSKMTAPLTIKNFAKFGVDLEKEFKSWQEKGLNPIEKSLGLIARITQGDAFKMGQLFNDVQAKAFITPLLSGVDEYARIKKSVESASGSVESDAARRRSEDPTQRWREMGDALKDLRDKAITPLLPPLTNFVNKILMVAAPISDWMTRNEALVAVLGTTLGTLLASKVAFSAAAYGIGLVKVAWAALGVAATANPLGLALKVIFGLATLVWANWETIGPKFQMLWTLISDKAKIAWDFIVNLWDGATTFFSDLWVGITGFFTNGIENVISTIMNFSPVGLLYEAISSALNSLGVDLPDKFSDFGKMMMQGLISGITNMGSAIKDSIVGVADSAVGWFKEKLGIQSPSRVFMSMGEMVGDGAGIGIEKSTATVGKAVAALGIAASAAFQPALAANPEINGLATTKETVNAVTQSSRIAAGTTNPTATYQTAPPASFTQHIEFNITQQPGENAQDLARKIAEIIKRETESSRRAALGDWA